jgi:hypothetical protein
VFPALSYLLYRRSVMINVTLVTNDGNGLPQDLRVRPDTTVGELLDVHFGGDMEDFSLQVRRDGFSQSVNENFELREGDRLSVAPRKVEGAK